MGGLMSGLQHVQDNMYPAVELEHAAKEAVDEVADGVDGTQKGTEDSDAERQPMPDAVPELGTLGQPVQQQRDAKSWWSWK